MSIFDRLFGRKKEEPEEDTDVLIPFYDEKYAFADWVHEDLFDKDRVYVLTANGRMVPVHLDSQQKDVIRREFRAMAINRVLPWKAYEEPFDGIVILNSREDARLLVAGLPEAEGGLPDKLSWYGIGGPDQPFIIMDTKCFMETPEKIIATAKTDYCDRLAVENGKIRPKRYLTAWNPMLGKMKIRADQLRMPDGSMVRSRAAGRVEVIAKNLQDKGDHFLVKIPRTKDTYLKYPKKKADAIWSDRYRQFCMQMDFRISDPIPVYDKEENRTGTWDFGRLSRHLAPVRVQKPRTELPAIGKWQGLELSRDTYMGKDEDWMFFRTPQADTWLAVGPWLLKENWAMDGWTLDLDRGFDDIEIRQKSYIYGVEATERNTPKTAAEVLRAVQGPFDKCVMILDKADIDYEEDRVLVHVSMDGRIKQAAIPADLVKDRPDGLAGVYALPIDRVMVKDVESGLEDEVMLHEVNDAYVAWRKGPFDRTMDFPQPEPLIRDNKEDRSGSSKTGDHTER